MTALRRILFGERAKPQPSAPKTHSVDIEGRIFPVRLKAHATARRMVLRMARDGKSFTLTVPKRQSAQSVQDFITASKVWMQNTLARVGAAHIDTAPETLQLRGENYSITRTHKTRGLVVCDPDAHRLSVPGADAHWKRRLVDWLAQQAEADLRKASVAYADKMQTTFKRLTVRDQKSRWGSCTSDGALSYSWRLILAPPLVLDYVAAHEVAHLREMNHGPRFWRLVLTHCPHTRAAKQWLKQNGHKLHHDL